MSSTLPTNTVNIYRTETGLRHQLRNVLNFYYPRCIDTDVGGYVTLFDGRDGYVYDARTRRLVATARAGWRTSPSTPS
jgi:mannose/cellobiose epimerase-like protein (N-acyl-D-glucosamine 2-epimerase family)